jgi:hypothetical protein
MELIMSEDNIKRVVEIQKEVSLHVQHRMAALIGTPEERPFMTKCMEAAIEVSTQLRDLVVSGMTYESWRDYFVDRATNSAFLQLIDNEARDLNRLYEEIQSMDLTEYYAVMVDGKIDLTELNQQIIEMEHNRTCLLEIWAEEDAEQNEVERHGDPDADKRLP